MTALVVGGGIAGAAFALNLANAGCAVTLIERETEARHKVCGEFISAEALFYLRGLGIDLDSLGAVPVERIRLFAGEREAATDLPFPARSLSRHVLDEALLKAAAARGAQIVRGCRVVKVERNGESWRAGLDNGSCVSPSELILATGKHDLRGWRRPPGKQNDLIGFKLHYRLAGAQTRSLRAAVELFLFPDGYAGMELVENDIANLCLVVRKRNFLACGGDWDSFFAAVLRNSVGLRHRLGGAQPCWPRPLAVGAIPYGFVQRVADGTWRLGDQAACTPSFSGDGMSIALHSAVLASHYFLQGGSAEEFQPRLARDVVRQVRSATLLSQLLLLPSGQGAAMRVARLFPGLLRMTARATRISDRYIKELRPAVFEPGMSVAKRQRRRAHFDVS